MKQLLICIIPILILSTSAARKDKKTTIEGVERGYITTKAQLSPPPLPKTATNSPTQFGFVPVKTIANYVQKEPKINYAQPQYVAENQEKNNYPSDISYLLGSQYSSGNPYTNSPVYTGPTKDVVEKSPAHTQVYYVPQAQNQYLKYKNVQYVADNNIDQGAGQQGYNTQQQYYLQQYQEPSTSIQAIVDPKGGLQYIMYIPTYAPNQATEQTTYAPNQAAEQTQNYENVNDQAYQSPQPEYTTYVEKPRTFESGKSTYNVKGGELPYRREPKSLLDSYVPSSVQIQYYKQAQLNSILRDGLKYENNGPVGAESTYRYNIRPTHFKR